MPKKGPLTSAEGSARRWRVPVVALVGVIALAAAAGLFFPWPLDMDEAGYTILAKGYRMGLFHRMVSQPGYPVCLPWGPALPLALVPVQALFGDGMVPAKIAVLASYPLFAALLALLFLKRFHPAWAAIGSLTVCLSCYVADHSWQVMTEIPSLLVTVVGLLAAQRWESAEKPRRTYPLLALVCIALAYLLREAGLALGVAIVLWMLLRRRTRVALVALAVTVAVPLFWHMALNYQARRVGKTFGSGHLSDWGGTYAAGLPRDPLAVRLRLLAASRPKNLRQMILTDMPELLRAVGYYQRMWNQNGDGKVSKAISMLFFLAAMLGAVFLLRSREPGGIVGVFALVSTAVVVVYLSHPRYLVPVYPFWVYTAMHAAARLNRPHLLARYAPAPLYAAGAALVVGGQVVALQGWDVYQKISYRQMARVGIVGQPFPERVAYARAAEWIGRAFPPMTEFIGTRKPTVAYVLAHEYSEWPSVSENLDEFCWYLDRDGVSLLIEDDFTAESTGPLRAVLAKGQGSRFRLLGAFHEGDRVARVWRYLPSPNARVAEPSVPPLSTE